MVQIGFDGHAEKAARPIYPGVIPSDTARSHIIECSIQRALDWARHRRSGQVRSVAPGDHTDPISQLCSRERLFRPFVARVHASHSRSSIRCCASVCWRKGGGVSLPGEGGGRSARPGCAGGQQQ